MTLASSGEISLGGSTANRSINLELGQAATATVSLNDANVRSLAGVASGAIVMPTNFYGKSNVSFDPDGGASAGTAVFLSDEVLGTGTATITITCTQSAVWTYTRSGSFGTPPTGSQTATSLTFSLTNSTAFFRGSTWTVSATAGGVTKYWNVQLSVDGGS
jgi:hypothetical protein